MEIRHKKTATEGSFFIEGDKKHLAEMTYTMADDAVMDINHTEVDPSLQGHNIGMNLIGEATKYAREKGLKINPLCSFVASVVNKNREKYIDIL